MNPTFSGLGRVTLEQEFVCLLLNMNLVEIQSLIFKGAWEIQWWKYESVLREQNWKLYNAVGLYYYLLFGSLIAENPSYLTGVGLYDAITSMSSIFTFET